MGGRNSGCATGRLGARSRRGTADAVHLTLSCSSTQSLRFSANVGDARVDQKFVDDDSQKVADQDRREGNQHGRYVVLQMAEVAIPPDLFADILQMIAELRPLPLASTT